jgi:hypothetical protein
MRDEDGDRLALNCDVNISTTETFSKARMRARKVARIFGISPDLMLLIFFRWHAESCNVPPYSKKKF